MALSMDAKFEETFSGKVHQAFFYLIDLCNLSCKHCLYKPELAFQLVNKAIPFDVAVDLMKKIHELGAIKMTFMGGEPTLYHKLPELIHESKKIGYEYVRIDTNGMFETGLLDNPYLRELDEITFSLDGPDEEINDALRGPGVFKKCSATIKVAVEKKYNVQITTCVHKGMVKKRSENGEIVLLEMIEYAKKLGVRSINMHDLFKAGIPRDVWTGDYGTSISQYINAFQDVFDRFDPKSSDGFTIRMPQCLVSRRIFDENPAYFGYCSVKQYDRLLVFPSGMIRVCSLLIGSPFCIGFYDDKWIYLNKTTTNETLSHQMDQNTSCQNQSKGDHFQDYLPLCVSFKPQQEEPVWVKRLKWEERRR